MRRWSQIANKLNREYDAAKLSLREERIALRRAKRLAQTITEAQNVAQTLAAKVQQDVHSALSRVVTKCLQTVFDDPYEFRILFEKKRGKTEARLVFLRDGQELDPMTASGGGAVDVAAFALRVASIAIQQPQQRRLLVLDEPFRFVSTQFRPRIRAMLLSLAEELDFQFVIVTHQEELRCGKVIDLSACDQS